jgi:hypothetical protein
MVEVAMAAIAEKVQPWSACSHDALDIEIYYIAKVVF